MLLGMVVAAAMAVAPRIAITSFTCTPDITPTLCESYERRFVDRLSASGDVAVTSQRDVEQALGIERQKQLMGCTDDASGSCIADIAGALAVDGILTGTLSRTKTGYLFTLKVVRSSDGAQWVSGSDRANSEPQLLDTIDLIAVRFADRLNGRQPFRPFRTAMFAAAGLGVAMTLTGGALFGLMKEQEALLRSDRPQTPLQIQQSVSTGSSLQGPAYALLSLGIPIAIAGLLLALTDPTADRIALIPVVSATGGLAWSWP